MDHLKLLELQNFVLWWIYFFDIINIRDVNSHKFEFKPSLLPFSRVGNPRFPWLWNFFLQYFQNWLASIERHSGNFSRNARDKMFISQQINERFNITINSIIIEVTFLLQHEASYVLTERFCQNSLVNYFGQQPSLGAGKNNPSFSDFGFKDNVIRNQEVCRPSASNIRA